MKKTENATQTAKKSQAAPAKKSRTASAGKTAAPKKTAPAKPEKKTIAQRKVSGKTGFHITPWLGCLALAALNASLN